MSSGLPLLSDVEDMKSRGYEQDLIEKAMKVRTVCQIIEDAFSGVVLGKGIGLHQSLAISDYCDKVECAWWRVEDEKNDWHNISFENTGYYSSFYFFDAEGMRFHLPAFMTAHLNGVCDSILLDFILESSPEKDERFSLLSVQQKQAVAAYLSYIINERPDEIRHLAENEIQMNEYWLGKTSDKFVKSDSENN